MKMNVENGLAGRFAMIDDRAVAIGVEMQIASDLGQPHQCRSYRGGVGFRHVVEARDVLSGNHQHVRGRLRIDVVKRDHVGVLINFFCRNLAVRDPAEETAITSSHAAIIRRRAEFRPGRCEQRRR